jgi:hypothetical protein
MNAGFRRLAAACAALLWTSAAAVAQTGAAGGSVRITVREAVSRAAIVAAHVRLVSDRTSYDGFTDRSGTVTFATVNAGSYGVYVSADGYGPITDRVDVSVSGVTATALTVLLERNRPRRIGAVESRSTPAPNAAQSRQGNDIASQLAGSVAQSLSSLPALGSLLTGDLAIHNHDSTTTAATINGAPIFPSGARNQLNLLSSDIFSSGAIGPGVAGAPNGTLALQTYDPSIDWTGLGQLRAASFGSQSGSVQERGSAGRLGVAYTHAYNDVSGPLDGRYFADTSGSAYYHDAVQHAGADSLTLRYGFTPSHVAHLDFGRLDDRLPALCTQQFGPLPCGFGPGSAQTDVLSYVQLRDNLELDRVSLDLHLFRSQDDVRYDESARTAFGANTGFSSAISQSRSGVVAGLRYLYGASHLASLSISALSDTSASNGQFGSNGIPVPVTSNSLSSIRFDLPLYDRARFHASGAVGRDASSGAASTTAGATLSYQATDRDRLSAEFHTGNVGSPSASFNGVGAASDVEVDCAGGRALGLGPQGGGTAATTSQARAGISHAGRRASFDVSLYRDVTRGGLASAVVPSSLASSLLPPGFLARVSAFATNACASPVTITPDRLAFNVSGPVSRLVDDGADFSFRTDIGERAHIDVAYSLSRSRAFGDDPLLFARGSTLVAGAQRPDTPTQRAALGFRYASSASTSFLANLAYFGAGNPYRVGAITTLDVGARWKTRTTDVVVGLQNAFGAAGGPFGGFDPFPHIARPFATPRTLSVRYRMVLGRAAIDRAQFLSTPARAGSILFFEPQDFEPAVRNWLTPYTEGAGCGPESLVAARRYLDAIAEFVATVEAARRRGEKPESVSPKDLPAMRLSATSDGTQYTIKIKLDFTSRRVLIPFLGCSTIHTGSYETASGLRLFIPGWQQREADGATVLYYAPQAGLYYPPPAVNATGVSYEAPTQLPRTPPRDPFTIVDAACPATYRAAVTDALGALRAYASDVYRGKRPSPPDGFTIVHHAAKTEDWLEIKADDVAFGNAVGLCVGAPTVAARALAQRGLAGAVPPSLNFAPSVGVYRSLP